jgi:putative sigma-54 modulation protein
MVNYNIKGTGLGITPELRSYAEKKLAAAEKFLRGNTTAHADIECEYSAMRDGDKYRAEYTLSVDGSVYRASVWGATMHEAIDHTQEQLIKELRRRKRKTMHMIKRGGAAIKNAIRGWSDRF